jgi:hypothetical protein
MYHKASQQAELLLVSLTSTTTYRITKNSYARFDQQICICHHLGPEYNSETSTVHRHWKNNDEKGPKIYSQASAYQDFKKIFKSVWEESMSLVDDPHQLSSKIITWDEALRCAQSMSTSNDLFAAGIHFLRTCSPSDLGVLEEFLSNKTNLSPALATLQQQLAKTKLS